MANNFKEITECLKGLIETQDFIVIPEFGALVMQLESAEFSIAENVLFPPRKKILFNPLLKHNDGLLIAELQKYLNIEFVLAQTLVNNFVQSLNILLQTKHRAELEGIGYFYKDLQGNILFESTLNPFYLSESFGLYPIHTIPVEKSEIFEKSTSITERKIWQLDRKNISRAAVVLIIFSILLLYWWISPFDLKNNLSSIFTKKPNYSIHLKNTTYPLIKTKFVEIPHKKITTQEISNELSNIHSSSIFSIVAGCFKIEQNAKKLWNEFKNKGLESSIRWDTQKELFVVSIGAYSEKEKAINDLNKLKISGILKDGWVKEIKH